jgi:hypothetical protein
VLTQTKILAAVLGATAAMAPSAQASEISPWGPALNAELVPGTSSELNTKFQDGCPIQSPDGLSLYLASNRPRFAGDTRTDLDIWVAHRRNQRAAWETPVNLGDQVNSPVDDFCPTPIRGGGLFFVSRRELPGVTCGGADIYFTRHTPTRGWRAPEHLACQTGGGPNTGLDEMGPSYVTAGGTFLYYSSGPEIYVSERSRGSFGVGRPVAELNSAAADIQPNVRRDGREIVFASNRNPLAGQDLWSATRRSVHDPWSAPVNLGPAVNTAANETRPSLSWDARTLYFGRAPTPEAPADTEGAGDIFVSTRCKR